MDATLAFILLLIAFALIFDYINGFHDAANSIATVVSTKVLSPRQAVFMAATTNLLGALLFESGLVSEAEDRFGELLERATEWQNDEFAARASNNLGVLANVRGERERALTFYQRALASYQRLGYLRGLAQTHYNLGVFFLEAGRIEEAIACYRKALGLRHKSDAGGVILSIACGPRHHRSP